MNRQEQDLECELHTNTKRWDRLFYPALIVFTFMMGFGFYTVYRISTNVQTMAENMDRNMFIIATQMQVISDTMVNMDHHVAQMGVDAGLVAEHMIRMNNQMDQINHNLYYMNQSTGRMSSDVNRMSTPMGMMRSMMPW
jgi:fumarate reductase subunit D